MANRKLKNFEYANHIVIDKSRNTQTTETLFFECSNGAVFVICKGSGRENLPLKSSQLAGERIQYYLENEFVDNPASAVYNALIYANGFIFEYARKNPDYNQLQVSCAILLIRDNRAYYSAMGDACIYFFNGRKFNLIARGDVTGHAPEGEITLALHSESPSYMGLSRDVVPYVNEHALVPMVDDMILMSDEVFDDRVSEKYIHKILTDPMPVQTKVYRLADMATRTDEEKGTGLQLISFYNLEHSQREFTPLKLKGAKKPAKEKSGKKPESTASSLENIKKKMDEPLVRVVLIVLAALIIGFMFWDMFIRDSRPVSSSRKTRTEAVTENRMAGEVAEEELTAAQHVVPEDQIYRVQQGDNWSRIYTRFGVCSWFIKNHPPNAGKLDSAENPVAGTQLHIPVLYSAKEELNPDFYQEFSLEKTGSRCENAGEAFLEVFREAHL